MNTKKGINLFVERAIAAMFKKYRKLYDGPIIVKPVVSSFNPDGITPLYRKKTLETMNFVKDKRCGKIKGRTCANWSKQRTYLKLDESVYSPTCLNEALMSTLVIDDMDQGYIAIFDVPGYFIQTEIPADKFLLIWIRDDFVDVMFEVNPE